VLFLPDACHACRYIMQLMRAVNSIQLNSVGVVSERELMRTLPVALVRAGSDTAVMLQHTVRLLEGQLSYDMCVDIHAQ
jgi:hypothetical protein